MTITAKLREKLIQEAKEEFFSKLDTAAVQALNQLEEANLDRARSEFAAHSCMTDASAKLDNGTKKFRLKDAKTGATRGIYNSKTEADLAHAKHPQKNSLVVEEFDPLAEEYVFEYHAKGSVNGKKFVIACDDAYDKKLIAKQNPHLTPDEVAAVHDHTESDEFLNGNDRTITTHNGITVRTHTQGGTHGDYSESSDKIKKLSEESVVPKSQIPAYKRKARGENELSLKDIEDEKNASPTTKEGMKNLQKKTGVDKE